MPQAFCLVQMLRSLEYLGSGRFLRTCQIRKEPARVETTRVKGNLADITIVMQNLQQIWGTSETNIFSCEGSLKDIQKDQNCHVWPSKRYLNYLQGRHGRFLAGKTGTMVATSPTRHRCCILFRKVLSLGGLASRGDPDLIKLSKNYRIPLWSFLVRFGLYVSRIYCPYDLSRISRLKLQKCEIC